MKRAYLQHAERQWRNSVPGAASRAAYWDSRYTPPPKVKRRGGHLRLVAAVAILSCGPAGFAYLCAMRILSDPLAVIGALLLTVLGTYLMLTVEDID